MEIIVVGPNADWPAEITAAGQGKGNLSGLQTAGRGGSGAGRRGRAAGGDEF